MKKQKLFMNKKDKQILAEVFSLEQADNVIALISEEKDPLSYPGVASWHRMCYNPPRKNELIMNVPIISFI